MNFFWWLSFAVVMSAATTGFLRRYVLTHRVVDVPNERSSHDVPIPRGGGVAIVVTFLTCVAVLVVSGGVAVSLGAGLLGAGAVAGTIGFLDDLSHIAARWRLGAHFLAAIWALVWLGGLPPIDLVGFSVNLGWLGHVLAAVGLVWMLNLYNFMDGIDGIAGLEAVTAGLGASALLLLESPVPEDWFIPALLAMAALGFLVWNWPPAGIFMGDAGSGFVGLAFGILAVQASWSVPALLWSWAVLLGVFIVDATVTLLRRVWRGEKPYEAHRRHAYQRAASRHGHKVVTVVVGVINLFWLLPISLLIGLGKLDGLAGVVVAYVPLVWLVIEYKAGVPLASSLRPDLRNVAHS